MVVSKNFLIFLMVGLMLVGTVSAANWYVDNAASPGGNGQSWSSAWNSFGNIGWGSVQPGDTVYLSGGVNQKVYTETLNIGASGSAGNLVTITKGVDTGHSGNVIIDGNGILTYGIRIDKSSGGGLKHIQIADLTLINHKSSVFIGDVAYMIYLDSLTIKGQRGQGGIFVNGWNSNGDPSRIDSIYIRNNYISSDFQITSQTDNIYIQYASNVYILNNVLYQLNTIGSGHNDNIQWANSMGNITVANNFMINYKQSNSQNLESQNVNSGSHIKIYNNVAIHKGTAYNIRISRNRGYVTGPPAKVYFYSNTIVGNMYSLSIWGTTGYDATEDVKNNIFKTSHVGGSLRVPSGGGVANYNYNIYQTGDARYAVSRGSSDYSWTWWQEQGAELNGLYLQPGDTSLFTNLGADDVTLSLNSPAIDTGTPLGYPYNVDKNGASRPFGAGWDIGAYEFGGTVNYHPADTNGDGCVDIGEIVAYVELWKNAQVTIQQVVSGVEKWQQGCP